MSAWLSASAFKLILDDPVTAAERLAARMRPSYRLARALDVLPTDARGSERLIELQGFRLALEWRRG
jgi:hypothetical protein